jgi:hypothetical protein
VSSWNYTLKDRWILFIASGYSFLSDHDNNHIVQVISFFINITKSIVETSIYSYSNEFAVYSYFLLNSITFMVYCLIFYSIQLNSWYIVIGHLMISTYCVVFFDSSFIFVLIIIGFIIAIFSVILFVSIDISVLAFNIYYKVVQ